MTVSIEQATTSPAASATIRPAAHQTSVPADQVLHSGNAGFIIARNVQLKNEFRTQGRKFFFDVIKHMNDSDLNGASFFAYEELFGTRDKLHWLINWNTPNDYAISLEMVDHDPKMIDLLESDVVEDDNGRGAWGRMVVEGSMQEKILVPQHGAHDQHEVEDHDSKSWVPTAWRQSSQPRELQLNSANAPLIVHRVGSAKHEFRKEARYFAFAWQELVNSKMIGRCTSYLYEETFGVMDQLHWLLHFASFEDYEALRRLEQRDRDFATLYDKQFVARGKGGGTWARTFADGGITDTLLVPYQLQD
jgi:hypothetical protein